MTYLSDAPKPVGAAESAHSAAAIAAAFAPFAEGLEKYAFQFVQQVVRGEQTALPLPDCSRHPFARRSMIQLRYLARRSGGQLDIAASPGTSAEDRAAALALARRLAFAADTARSRASRLTDVDPTAAEALTAFAVYLDLCAALLVALCASVCARPRHQTTGALTLPGRVALSRCIAANAPPAAGVAAA